MIARMPELSLSEISPSEKPRRLSISSWVRTRSAPPLALDMKLGAVVDHRRPLRGGRLAVGRASRQHRRARRRRRPPAPAPIRRPSASWSIWSFEFILSEAVTGRQFPEQHGVDAARRDRHIDPTRQLLLEAIETGGAIEVGRPQFTQDRSGTIHDARHRGLDLRLLRASGSSSTTLTLRYCVRSPRAGGEIDQHLGHVEEHGRLGLRRRQARFPCCRRTSDSRRSAAADHDERGGNDDDHLAREPAFRGGARRALFLGVGFGSSRPLLRFRCHRVSRSSVQITARRTRAPRTAYPSR